MTAPYGTSGNEPVTAPGIHDTDWVAQAAAPRTQEQMRATGEAMVKIIMAQVLYAISGINILGVSLLDPFGLLRAFADELVQQANDAYDNAFNAQGSANTANAGVTDIYARLDAGDVSGDYLFDTFDRTGSDMGPNYFQRYVGPGAGGWGTNGSSVHWSQNGATELTGLAIHDTALTTNYQSARIVHGLPTDASNVKPRLYIILRSNATLDTYVIASVANNTCEIGYVISDTYTRIGAAEAVNFADGDSLEFRAGTAADDYQFLLYRNGALVCDRTDAAMASQMGASYLQAGFGQLAGIQFFGFFFSQIAPADIHSFAAADRTP